jgi:hypothetical protein
MIPKILKLDFEILAIFFLAFTTWNSKQGFKVYSLLLTN